MVSARTLQPGPSGDFRRAWLPAGPCHRDLTAPATRATNRDEGELISFGLSNMSRGDYHRRRGEADAEENRCVEAVSAFVENEYVYEVVDSVQD
jgi:hypothetical protein